MKLLKIIGTYFVLLIVLLVIYMLIIPELSSSELPSLFIYILFLLLYPYLGMWVFKKAPHQFEDKAEGFKYYLMVIVVLFVFDILSPAILYHRDFYTEPSGTETISAQYLVYSALPIEWNHTFKYALLYVFIPYIILLTSDILFGKDFGKVKRNGVIS